MAIGGALRAAIRAGRFSVAGRESRRQARALASLNARGGIRGGEGMSFARAGEGTSERTLESLIDRGFQPDMYSWYAPGLRGNTAFIDPNTGTRTILPPDPRWSMTPNFRNPIEAPYEGVRVWPGTRLPGFGESMQVGAVPGGTMRSTKPGVPFSVGEAPPWLGRGPVPAPTTGRFFPRDMSYGGGRMYDFEMGELQGQQFFAPSIPVPSLPSFYFDDLPF